MRKILVAINLDEKFVLLMNKLNYQFKDKNLLMHALKHRSCGQINNERFEFLGDSILNFVIADTLYKQFPKATEGELTRFRASLVNKNSLVDIANELNIVEHIEIGKWERKNASTHRSESVLSDAVEAIICAIYQDSDFEKTRQIVLHWYNDKIKNINQQEHLKDPKTRLQELLQARKMNLPEYNIESISGEPQAPLFAVICIVSDLDLHTTGEGTSKRRAEQAAALLMLEKIKI